MDGVLNIYKERGFTSHDVVAKLRGMTHQKKIGHTGTLDPEAEGVLLVCFGAATKLCDAIGDYRKAYHATMQLGVTTDTQDSSGTILEQKEVQVSADRILEAILSFQGEYDQVPPMYSARKVNGKRLYELARKGESVERKPKRISIYSITVEYIDMVSRCVSFTVECSRGTYIRTLCADIGEKLGCGAVMTSLIRTKVGDYSLETAHRFSEISNWIDEGTFAFHLVPIEAFFMHYPGIKMNLAGERFLRNGNPFAFAYIDSLTPEGESILLHDAQFYRVYDNQGVFQAVYHWDGSKNLFYPTYMFLH